MAFTLRDRLVRITDALLDLGATRLDQYTGLTSQSLQQHRRRNAASIAAALVALQNSK